MRGSTFATVAFLVMGVMSQNTTDPDTIIRVCPLGESRCGPNLLDSRCCPAAQHCADAAISLCCPNREVNTGGICCSVGSANCGGGCCRGVCKLVPDSLDEPGVATATGTAAQKREYVPPHVRERAVEPSCRVLPDGEIPCPPPPPPHFACFPTLLPLATGT